MFQPSRTVSTRIHDVRDRRDLRTTVSLGKWNSNVAIEAATTAISIPGHVGRQCRRIKIVAAEPIPMPNAAGLSVGNA
jgi:hypothetical protein